MRLSNFNARVLFAPSRSLRPPRYGHRAAADPRGPHCGSPLSWREKASPLKAVIRPAHPPSPAFLTTLAILLALGHAVLAVTAMADKSMTSDEIAHLTAGQAYNTRDDYRLQPENGNLPQRLAALPLTLAGDPLPPPSLASWQTADVWKYGHTFFYEGSLPAGERLFLGRAVISLLSAATALLVFFWSRALFGWSGAFISLGLFVFSPTLLAHGALATSDVTMTFFFLATVGAWWRHLERPGAQGAAISAGAMGLSLVAKFSAVLLPPMLALLGLAWAWGESRRGGWRRPLQRLARTTGVHVVVAGVIIWVFYGFRFSAFAPGLSEGATFNHGWGWLLSDLGFPAKVIWRLKEWQLLPEAWLHGLTFVLQFSRARGAFMSGEYGITGWIAFFPWAFLIKTPLPFLLLLLTGLVAAVRRGLAAPRRVLAQKLRPLLPLAVLFGIYGITSLFSHLNIGHRHILPLYPVLFIAAGWLATALDFRRPVAAAWVAGLLLWDVGASWHARPNYLAYFNPIVGGSANGWRHLVDSSLDWGQDLPGLKRWLDANARGERVFLSYFGTGDPRYEGIVATALPSLPEVGPPRKWQALAPGLYAISVTMLQHVYSSQRGEWTLENEREFQRLRALEPTLLTFQQDPARRTALLVEAPEASWTTAWKRYETLRFARLCHYLRVRRADAVIGYTIRVYRLSAAEIAAATGGSAQAWRAAIEQAVADTSATGPN